MPVFSSGLDWYTSRGGSLFMVLFFSFFLFSGLMLTYMTINMSLNYVETEGVVIEVGTWESLGDGGYAYKIQFIDQQTGKQLISMYNRGYDEKYSVGQKLTIFYNPKLPNKMWGYENLYDEIIEVKDQVRFYIFPIVFDGVGGIGELIFLRLFIRSLRKPQPSTTSYRFFSPSLLTALTATLISFLSVKLNYFPDSPIVLFIPFISSIIGISVYYKLIHRNEIFNMVRREGIIFGLISAIFWALFTLISGTTIFTNTNNEWSIWSIIPTLFFGFIVFTCGTFFYTHILPQIGFSLGKQEHSPPLNPSSAHRRKLLAIIVFVVILIVPIAVFPTPHIRSVNGLLQSFQFNSTINGRTYPSYLFGGQSIQKNISTPHPKIMLGAMTFRTVIDVKSSENVMIAVAITESYYSPSGILTNFQAHVSYNETGKTHKTSFEQAITGDNVRIRCIAIAKNPSPLLFPNGNFPIPNMEILFTNGTLKFSIPFNETMPAPLTMNGSIKLYWEYQYIQYMEWWRP